MKKFYGVIALLGFFVSLVSHILSLAGINIAYQDNITRIFGVCGVITIMGISYYTMRDALTFEPEYKKSLNPIKNFKVIISGIPKYMLYPLAFIFLYSLITNISGAINSDGARAVIENGRYMLSRDGMLSSVSFAEYTSHACKELALTSSLYLFIFSASIGLYTRKFTQKLESKD
jgi:hypothetical protein